MISAAPTQLKGFQGFSFAPFGAGTQALVPISPLTDAELAKNRLIKAGFVGEVLDRTGIIYHDKNSPSKYTKPASKPRIRKFFEEVEFPASSFSFANRHQFALSKLQLITDSRRSASSFRFSEYGDLVKRCLGGNNVEDLRFTQLKDFFRALDWQISNEDVDKRIWRWEFIESAPELKKRGIFYDKETNTVYLIRIGSPAKWRTCPIVKVAGNEFLTKPLGEFPNSEFIQKVLAEKTNRNAVMMSGENDFGLILKALGFKVADGLEVKRFVGMNPEAKQYWQNNLNHGGDKQEKTVLAGFVGIALAQEKITQMGYEINNIIDISKTDHSHDLKAIVFSNPKTDENFIAVVTGSFSEPDPSVRHGFDSAEKIKQAYEFVRFYKKYFDKKLQPVFAYVTNINTKDFTAKVDLYSVDHKQQAVYTTDSTNADARPIKPKRVSLVLRQHLVSRILAQIEKLAKMARYLVKGNPTQGAEDLMKTNLETIIGLHEKSRDAVAAFTLDPRSQAIAPRRLAPSLDADPETAQLYAQLRYPKRHAPGLDEILFESKLRGLFARVQSNIKKKSLVNLKRLNVHELKNIAIVFLAYYYLHRSFPQSASNSETELRAGRFGHTARSLYQILALYNKLYVPVAAVEKAKEILGINLDYDPSEKFKKAMSEDDLVKAYQNREKEASVFAMKVFAEIKAREERNKQRRQAA